MKNYSQNKEQDAILEYFKGLKTGSFIDIGSNDGVTLSNTRAIAELGWCGVLVEPSPRAFHLLKQNYKELETKGCYYLYPFAIGVTNGDVTLYESGALLGKDDVALVSTLIPEEMNRFKSVLQYYPVTVECFRWKTFENRLTIKKFDFISIDIEGLELEVLEQMDVSDTLLICVETNGNMEKKAKLDVLLSEFKIIYTSGENLIYAR